MLICETDTWHKRLCNALRKLKKAVKNVRNIGEKIIIRLAITWQQQQQPGVSNREREGLREKGVNHESNEKRSNFVLFRKYKTLTSICF